MLLGLVPQFEKEAMGLVVAAGALALAVPSLRSGRYAGRPAWSAGMTRVIAAALAVAGIAAAIASFVVNVEPGSGWGTARDKAVFAAWLAVVALAAVLIVRRARSRKAAGVPPLG